MNATYEERLKDLNETKKQFPNWSMKLKDFDKDNNREKALSGKDSCVDYSYFTWIRLYKIKAKRARGQTNSDYFYNPNNDTHINFHYWVESDKFVFNETAFITSIIPIKEFYDFYRISNVEYSVDGVFKTFNDILKTTRDDNTNLEHHRLFLEKQRKIIKN